MGKWILAVLALGLALPALAQESLCASNEKVYFSCKLPEGLLVSLCGDVAIDKEYRFLPEQSWLQYRAGTPGQVAYEYPTQRRHSLSKFKIIGEPGTGSLPIVFTDGGVAHYMLERVHFEQGFGQLLLIGDPKDLINGLHRDGPLSTPRPPYQGAYTRYNCESGFPKEWGTVDSHYGGLMNALQCQKPGNTSSWCRR